MLYQQLTAYAIEVLGFLAGLDHGTKVRSKTLAEILQIPPQYLSKVLTHLVKKRFIVASTGPNGGVSLAVKPDTVTLYRVLASLDGVQNLEDKCVMGLGLCSSATACALHESWSVFKETAIAKSRKLTLSDISEILRKKLRSRENKPRLTFQELLSPDRT